MWNIRKIVIKVNQELKNTNIVLEEWLKDINKCRELQESDECRKRQYEYEKSKVGAVRDVLTLLWIIVIRAFPVGLNVPGPT
jgi:hypothetical protein